MSSRDPEDLQEDLEDIDFSGDIEQLSELRAEAHRTVDAQIKTLEDIDTKASKILRLNIVLIGILVSVLSLATQSQTGNGGMALDPLLNEYNFVGIGALVFSTAFAAMTYTASELDVGTSYENLQSLLEADFSRDEAEELLVKNYITRINFNRSTNVRNIPLVQLTIVLVVVAVVSFMLGVYEATLGPVPFWLLGGAIVLVCAVVWISGLPRQLRRAVADRREWR